MVLLPHTMNMITHLASWRPEDVVICLEELKMSLMACNCICPGAITLLASLFSGPVSQRALQHKADLMSGSTWQHQYLVSRSNSLYPVQLPAVVVGLPFNLAASYLYSTTGVLLVALVPHQSTSTQQQLFVNPAQRQIEPGDCGVLIASGSRALDDMAENSEIFEAIQQDRGMEAAREYLHATQIHAKAQHLAHKDHKSPVPHKPMRAVSSAVCCVPDPKGCVPMDEVIRGADRTQLLARLLHEQYNGDIDALVKEAREAPSTPPPLLPHSAQLTGNLPRVLICGYVSSMALCVRLLCEAGFCISILASNLPTSCDDFCEEWRHHVTFVRGSCLSLMDLERAGLHTAQCALVLAKESFLQTGAALIDELVQDTDALLIYKLIKAHAPQVRVTTELVDSSHVVFMQDSGAPETLQEDAIACRCFASGEVYSSMLASLLMSKLHVLPNTMQLLPELLRTTEQAGMRLHLRAPPEGYVGKVYSDMVLYLTEIESLLPFGLLRAEGDGPDMFNVVLANPRPDLVIENHDMVYVFL
eukprot:TRINITY_DN1023_c0_g1_i6.p1 TRINITY_DN1023_c0_g1~~TRINITY_DN1023_c0_g1_i6.p1  ORF type:complete len:531 (+),score=146.54 TRINITY_DN1023_c0_g1_i6:214-1806(+)